MIKHFAKVSVYLRKSESNLIEEKSKNIVTNAFLVRTHENSIGDAVISL